MNSATIVRTQVAVAVFSLASLVVFASSSPADSAQEVQSFIGTTPSATMSAEQPATF